MIIGRTVSQRRGRLPNPRLVKVHRSYTVEEIAGVFGVHKNSVRNWIKRGLPVCDDRRPMLVLGRDLVAFLVEQRSRNKQRCSPGEMYCLRCRTVKCPAERLAEFKAITDKVGNLSGICPDCDSLMNRRVSIGRLAEVVGNLEVTFTKEQRHIIKRALPNLHCDFNQED